MKAYLVECGRKFVFLLRIYYYYCQGTVFYIKGREPIKIFIDSRIILNTIFFIKINLNYIRP